MYTILGRSQSLFLTIQQESQRAQLNWIAHVQERGQGEDKGQIHQSH